MIDNAINERKPMIRFKGFTEAWIMKNIGMDAEEVLRLKQISGLQQLFKDKEFSKGCE